MPTATLNIGEFTELGDIAYPRAAEHAIVGKSQNNVVLRHQCPGLNCSSFIDRKIIIYDAFH